MWRPPLTVLAPGGDPRNPRWLKAPFLRHGALAGVAATTHIEKYCEPPP